MSLSYFDALFWILIAALATAMHFTQRKQLAFGLLNGMALCFVADLQTALIGATCAFVGWCALSMTLRARAISLEHTATRNRALVATDGKSAVEYGEVTSRSARGHSNPSAGDASVLSIALTLLCLAMPAVFFVGYKLAIDYRMFAGPFGNRFQLQAIEQSAQALRLIAFSYVVLRYCDAVHSILWKNARLLDPISFMGYLVPFHMLLCGPVNRYDEHLRWASPVTSVKNSSLLLGLNDVTTGLFYKFVIAEYWKQYFFGNQLVSSGWIDTALIFIYLFFDFAGYSRIALGIGRWLGVPTPVNFNAPFLATSVTDFFTRWHMSLGSFVLRNIFTPIQLTLTRRWGVKNAWRVGMIALLAGWLFVGLWHRLSIAFLLYGIGMGTLVWVEKWVRDRMLKKAWARTRLAEWAGQVLGPIYVFVVLTTAIHWIIREIF